MIFGSKVINRGKFPEIFEIKFDHKIEPITISLNVLIGFSDSLINDANNLFFPIITHNNSLKYISLLFLNNLLVGIINNLQYLIIINDSFMITTQFN